MEGQSAVVVAPSCGESGSLQGAGQDSPQDGGGEADQDLVQSGAHERRSHLEWAR